MTMLDQLAPDPVTVSPRPTAMRYGLIWGAIAAGISLIGNLLGMDPGMPDTNMAAKVIFGLIGFAVPIWAIAMAIKVHRDNELGGYITLGRSMGLGTLTGLIAGLIGAVWMALFLYLISPDYISQLMDAVQAQWEEQGMGEEQIEMAMKFTAYTMTPIFFIVSQIFSGVFMGFIVGLIAGAIMKRERPNVI